MHETMALRAHIRGGAAGLRYEQAPRPTLETGDVLVEVNAAGITFAELGWAGMRRGPVTASIERPSSRHTKFRMW